MYTQNGTLDKSETIQRYSPLVMRMARHLMAKLPASVEIDDIVQAGMIGLMDAANRYESAQGTQFETFATQRIRGAMLDELRQNDWLPRSLRKTQRKVESAISALEQKLGRPPQETEIAKEMGVKLAEYQEMLAESRGYQLFSYDDFMGEDKDEQFLERHCPDPDADPLAQLQDKRFKSALVQAIKDLPEREQLLMGLYYEQDLNFREIAAVMGVTESRVCQLHSQAVARLRAKLREG
ncbi:MAG: RNA polymerase sigma factor FliA [Burkholderiales bacterium]|nr:RNA polymerase sigma factor FliA [Burkholderiales bacterium]